MELLKLFAVSPDYLRRQIEGEIHNINKGLIISVLKAAKIPLAKYDDFYQEASKGLLLAIRRYDLSRGIAFSTFAINTMKGIVKNNYRDHEWHMSVSRLDKEKGVRLLKTSIDQHDPKSEETARLLKLISAQTPLSITDELTKTPDLSPSIENNSDLVGEILGHLDPKHRFWIDAVFMKGYEPQDLSIALIQDLDEIKKKIKSAIRACKKTLKLITTEEDIIDLY